IVRLTTANAWKREARRCPRMPIGEAKSYIRRISIMSRLALNHRDYFGALFRTVHHNLQEI
ncbi:MAG TPA: hypothetical protein VIJ90_06555, partial [Gemmatimonadaceae bacterium]